MQPANLIFLTSTLTMGCYYLNHLTVSASFRVSLLVARQRLCQDRVAYAPPEDLGRTNRHIISKKVVSKSFNM